MWRKGGVVAYEDMATDCQRDIGRRYELLEAYRARRWHLLSRPLRPSAVSVLQYCVLFCCEVGKLSGRELLRNNLPPRGLPDSIR